MISVTDKITANQSDRVNTVIPIRYGEVLTSRELIGRIEKTGQKAANARQILRRQHAQGIVWRSADLKLAYNERLFALPAFRGSPGFYAAVAQKIAETNRFGIARCLDSLARQSVLHKIEVMRLLAVAPSQVEVNDAKQRRLYENELRALKEIGIRIIHQGTSLECLHLPDLPAGVDASEAATLANRRLGAELLIARILIERLRQQNIVAWNQIEIPDAANPYTVFNNQVFTASGFSYLMPVVRWREDGKLSPCPVVIDCCLGTCSRMQAESFVERIERISVRKAGRCRLLGILAARGFDTETWRFARSKGIVTVNLRQQFGEQALDAMVQVEKIVHNLMGGKSGAAVEPDFLSFVDIINGLRQNPVAADLRAVGFEALAALILSSNGCERVTLGKVVPHRNTVREVDLYAWRGDELHIIECKAYHRGKSITAEGGRKFVTETVPALKKWLRATHQQFQSCVAEIWTTGAKGNEASKVLYELSRPGTDKWGIKRRDEIIHSAPEAIKERSTKLLESIALNEHGDTGDTDK